MGKNTRGKGRLHTAVQSHLQIRLEGALLEHPFPEIGRIADLFWRPYNLIFEVQVSPIKAREVQARNRDYRSIGLDIVWVLHDKRFNKRVITPAEEALQNSPHFYTNIDASGVGVIYGQLKSSWNGRVQKRTPRYPVALERPYWWGDDLHFVGEAPKGTLPPPTPQRRANPYRALLERLIELID